MSTRSAIVLKSKNGTYRGIYCHYDGYPSGVGRVLFNHYSGMVRMPLGYAFHQGRGKAAVDKIRRLLDLGGLRSLGPTLDPPPPDTDLSGDVTSAFHRDRGDKKSDVKAVTGRTLKSVTDPIDHNYAYLFERGRWLCNGKPLTPADVMRE